MTDDDPNVGGTTVKLVLQIDCERGKTKENSPELTSCFSSCESRFSVAPPPMDLRKT